MAMCYDGKGSKQQHLALLSGSGSLFFTVDRQNHSALTGRLSRKAALVRLQTIVPRGTLYNLSVQKGFSGNMVI